MGKTKETPQHVKAILREKVLVPREWLRHGKEDIARALLIYGTFVKVYAPFGGGNAIARLKVHEHVLKRDGYSRAPVALREELQKTAMDEANHRPLDLVEIDNPINTIEANVGCPNCGDEYEIGCYDVREELFRRKRR